MAFIRQSWLASDRLSAAARDEGPGYMQREKARITGILARETTRLVCAVSADDTDAIVGFAVVAIGLSLPRVYYIYIRPDARSIGLGRRMLAHYFPDLSRAEATHRPPHGSHRLPDGWTYVRDANHPRHDT